MRIGGNRLSLFLGTLLYGRHGLSFIIIANQPPSIYGMKTFSGFARRAGCQSTRGGIFWLALVLTAAMFVSGCGKGKSTGPVAGATPPAQTTQGSSQATVPASDVNSQPMPAQPATNGATASPDVRQLNQELIRWIVQNHQRPKTFEDFVARANIQVTPPPAGKKYVIDKHGFIALVDSSTN